MVLESRQRLQSVRFGKRLESHTDIHNPVLKRSHSVPAGLCLKLAEVFSLPASSKFFFFLTGLRRTFTVAFTKGGLENYLFLENLTEDLGFVLKRDCNAGVDNL